jgi:hypothetical protein
MGLVTDEALAEEAARYGAAGGKPQVVWPNGILASIAVGFFMKPVAPWETHKETPLLLEYDGDVQTVAQSNKLAYLPAHCKHFDRLNDGIGRHSNGRKRGEHSTPLTATRMTGQFV